ncbi:hypothetical protein VTJ83DRAFT_5316 [Remersonia thermophila]|uniref:Uncharacterized protein n=1 Tax=Remersonia thermophila TaxID=72144 RepID=A0ABR4D8N7_9PEZI
MTQSFEPQRRPIETQEQCHLLRLLTNSLVLSQTAPYLSCYDVLNLAATAQAFRYLVYNTPNVFRRLDLSQVKRAQFEDRLGRTGGAWDHESLDRSLTQDEIYSDPLRRLFSKLRRVELLRDVKVDILRDVQVLCLDGLSVTGEFIHDVLTDPSFSIRILSIRGVKNLNERMLRGALQYACRESRPEGMPRLRGLYVFGPRDATPARPDTPGSSPGSPASVWNNRSQQALTASLADEPEAWWVRRGSQFPCRIDPEWASTLVACAGIIAFDSVLCSGPRHFNSPAWGKLDTRALDVAAGGSTHFAVATHSLGGCASCGSAPEGWTVWGEDSYGSGQARYGGRRSSESFMSELSKYPLLAPPPRHSASIRVAMCPTGQPVGSPHPGLAPRGKQQKARFIPRCFECIRHRYCAGCHRWWCESCYADNPSPSPSPSPVGGSPAPSDDGLTYVSRSCWECGMNCKDCISNTQRVCQLCKGGYCLLHNEGSNMERCDWCVGRGRRRFSRDLY